MEALSNSHLLWNARETSIFYYLVLFTLVAVLAYEFFWLFVRKNSPLSQGIFSEKFRDDLAWSVIPLIALIALSWVGTSVSSKKKQPRAERRPAVLSEVKGGS